MPKELDVSRRDFFKMGVGFAALSGLSSIPLDGSAAAAEHSDSSPTGATNPRGWTPQPYTLRRNDQAGTLTLSTRYYTIEHQLNKGGAISKINYAHGNSANLLLRPIEARVRLKVEQTATDEEEQHSHPDIFSDLNDTSPAVSISKSGKAEVVTIEAALVNQNGIRSGITTRTVYSYRWGYIKIHKEFHFPENSVQVRRISVVSTLLDPSLTRYSYKPNIFEDFSPEIHTWEVNAEGKMRAGTHFDTPFQTRFIPRYLTLANPGVEGIEWFVSDDLSQWDYQITGEPGTGNTLISSRTDPLGIELSIDSLDLAPSYNLPKGGFIEATGSYSFDYYIGVPILEGHAQTPWFERSYGPNGGKWVSEEEIKRNADLGVVTMTLHDDGDVNNDGLYWRDGSWPPYPPDQMKKMAGVIDNCHKYGIKTVPYFSCHELSYSTEESKMHAEEWGRKADDQGNIRPNHYYGALMCLKSGWLSYLKFSVDRVLKHYPFDGVYYDWNLALYCNNPLHMGKVSNGVSGEKGLGTYANSATGHWDVDELLEFVEWSRERVGPDGLVLLHTTMAPMFATENFANDVCCMEFGYGQVATSMPPPDALPLEWNFAGARSRAVIEYGALTDSAPATVHQSFYLTALITGVATWPASDEALKLFKLLDPLGDLNRYQFEDWQNQAVRFDENDCYSAVYSRSGEAYLVLVNLSSGTRDVKCSVNPKAFKNPIASPTSAENITLNKPIKLNLDSLLRGTEKISLPAETAMLLHIK
jgi:hypothetical protein